MTDLKKEKPIYTRKIGTSFLNKANDEAIKINEKIKSEEELPEYYITSLFRRNEDLRVEAYAALDIIEKSLKKDLKKSYIECGAMVTLGLANVALLFTVLPVGIITSIVYAGGLYKRLKKLSKEDNETLKKELEETLKKADNVIETISDNEQCIVKKITKMRCERLQKEEEVETKVNAYMEANYRIQEYVRTGIVPKNLDEETKNTIINMLQNDLNTTETDLEKLLKATKEQISKDTITRKLENK